MNKKTRPLHMLPIKDSLQIKRHTQTERNGMEKDIAFMDLESIILNEVSQIEKDRYHMMSLHAKSKEQNKQ